MTDFKRMALALTSAQLAKDTTVKQHGIGEDIPTHFLGWSPSNLLLVGQMNSDLQKSSHDNRLMKSDRFCQLLRKNWWVTSITMVAEGYCSFDSRKTNGMDLATAFLNANLPVYECITVSHVTENDNATVSMVAAPYRIGLGKVVKWNEVLAYPENTEKYISPSRYSMMLKRVMSVQMEEDLNQEKMDSARSEVRDLGFSLQEFM